MSRITAGSRKHFVTFADRRMIPSLRRIVHEARNLGVFQTISPCTEMSLDAAFLKSHSAMLTPATRGFGYWIWKPQIILQTLATLPPDDLLVYCDAGCRFTQRGHAQLESYFTKAQESAVGIAGFQYFPPVQPFPYDGRPLFDWRNHQWIKGDTLVYFGLHQQTAFLREYSFGAGIVFMRNTPDCREVLREWIATMEADLSLLDDSPSRAENPAGFIEHRHDQAIFNCLAYKHRITPVCGYELEYPSWNRGEHDWQTIADYPIHARRDKRFSLSGRLRAKLRGLWAR
jgi:hypothetical protein